jgi:two-component sensor histidine kinase
MKRVVCIIISVFFICHSNLFAGNNLDVYKEKLVTYRYTKYLDSVKFYFNKVLPLALKQNDSVSVFYLYKHLGDAYEHHHFIDSTLKMYDVCEKYIPANNYKLKAFLVNDKAYTYHLLYDDDKSAELRLQALELAKISGDKREIANVTLDVAAGFAEINLYKQAEQYYLQSIQLAQSSNDTAMLSYAYRYYGAYLINVHQYNAAQINLSKALQLSGVLKDSISLAFTWHHLADYYWNVKKTDSCFYVAKKAEGIWERRAEYIDLSAVCMQMGKYYLVLNNYVDAEYYLKKSEKYILNDIYFNETLWGNLADLYNKKGNTKLAFDYLLRAKKLTEEIKEKEKAAKALGLQLKFETDQKEIEIKKEKEGRALADLNSKNKTAQRNIIFMVLVFIVIMLAIIVFAYFKIKDKNKLLNKSNTDLENLAHQKQILLKEVHHRVKNNLTTLKSLFYLQAKSSDKAEVKLALEECQQRIQSMALIHQSLYEENENEKIEFLHFLKQLFNELELSSKPADKEIEIEYKGMNIELDMSTALFLGLILNELATNSFKYAFTQRAIGKIGVELQKATNKLTVIYYDSGNGLSFDYEEGKGGFGFKLMRILTQQINATITYQKLPDASQFKIEIPLEQ